MGKRKHRSHSPSSLKRLEKRLKKLEHELRKKKEKKSRDRSDSSSSKSSYSDENVNVQKDDHYSDSESSSPLRDVSNTRVQREKSPLPRVDRRDVNKAALPVEIVDLDPALEDILNKKVTKEASTAPAIHKSLADSWLDVLQNGLSEEMREKLYAKYPLPDNCGLLNPPVLNTEIKVTLAEKVRKRDDRIIAKQVKVAACIGAVGKVLTPLIKRNVSPEEMTTVDVLGDVGILLADLQHDENTVRKTLALYKLDNRVKEALNDTNPDKSLFSSKMEDTIKAAKIIQTTVNELKTPTQQKPQSPYVPKNRKFPPGPRSKPPSTQGGQKRPYRKSTSSDQKSRPKHRNYRQ